MKTSIGNLEPRKRRRGSALIAVLAMLAIMFVLFTVNNKALIRLSREVDALDKRQTQRLAHTRAPTNAFKANP
jgi:hypothetical protein